MKQLLHTFDTRATAVIRRLPQSWRPAIAVLTQLGHPITVVVIASSVYLSARLVGDDTLLIAAAIIPATLMVGSLIKLLFSRARPLNERAASVLFGTYSFPSGHSTGAMVAYGLLGLIAMNIYSSSLGLVVAALCALVVAFIGVSRIYLNYHYPSDVAAGWLLGAVALVLIIVSVNPFGPV